MTMEKPVSVPETLERLKAKQLAIKESLSKNNDWMAVVHGQLLLDILKEAVDINWESVSDRIVCAFENIISEMNRYNELTEIEDQAARRAGGQTALTKKILSETNQAAKKLIELFEQKPLSPEQNALVEYFRKGLAEIELQS